MSVNVLGEIKYYDISEKTYGKYNNHMHKLTVNDQKYSFFNKSNEPLGSAKPGDTVEFQAEQNDKGYWNADPKTFKVKERGRQQSQTAKAVGGEDDRQGSILRQSSTNYSVNMVSALLQAGHYQGLSDEEIVEHVIHLADTYFLPYSRDGQKPSGVNPISDFDGDDSGDDLPPF